MHWNSSGRKKQIFKIWFAELYFQIQIETKYMEICHQWSGRNWALPAMLGNWLLERVVYELSIIAYTENIPGSTQKAGNSGCLWEKELVAGGLVGCYFSLGPFFIILNFDHMHKPNKGLSPLHYHPPPKGRESLERLLANTYFIF